MTATTFTGALNGIASNAINADNAVTAGWATTAGLAITANRAITAAYALNATTAKNAVTAGYAATADYAFNAGTATYATTAGHATDSTKLPLSGGTMTGALTLAGDPSIDNDAATKKYVDTQISNVSGPMKFKGTLGATSTGATVNSLSNPSTANLGYTYKVLTEGTYQGVSAKVGDLMVSTGTLWVNIPSGDEPDGTVKTISTGDGLTGGPISVTGTVSHAIPSGATASTLGSSSDRTYIKSITTDKFGHITGVGTGSETVTNSDSKQNVVLNQTTKAYITAVTATPTSTPQALTAIADTDVYLDTTSGQLAAKSFKITGTSNSSNTLTSDATNNVYFQVNSKTPLVVMDTAVRPGLSYDNTVTLGATNAKWKNVYATTFTGNLNGKAENANYAGTATYSSNAGTATYAKNATTAKYATTSSYADTAVTANYATTAGNATYAESTGSIKKKVFYGTCDTATATVAKEVVCDEFTADDLVKGVTIFVTFTYTNSGAEGSLTLNVNNTTAKPLKSFRNASVANIPGKTYIAGGQTYRFSYDGTNWVTVVDYDTNDVNISRITYSRFKTGAVGISRYGLFMEATDGTVQGLTSTFNSTGTSHVKNSNTFKLGRIYYNNKSSADIAANTTVTDNNWAEQQTGLVDLRYSTNCSTTLTANKPVYIVGSVNSAGQFTLDDVWYTQTLPTEENGKVYIYLGIVYPDTNPYRVAFEIENSIYCYKNGGIQLFQNWAKYSDNAASADTATTAGYATTAGHASTAGYASTAGTAQYSTTAGHATDDTKLPLAGGTMTGGINLVGNQSSAWNNKGLVFTNGSRIGESTALGIYSVGQVYIRPNASTATNTEGIEINADGLRPSSNNTELLGDSSHKWKNVYATTFTGNLAGIATTANEAKHAATANSATTASEATHAATANSATTASEATHAATANTATTAGFATTASQATHAATANSATTASEATHAATANSATTATNAQKVIQTNQTGANDYRVLLSGSANDTTEYSGTNKNTNLRFNPSTQLLSLGGSITATGDLTIGGNADIEGEGYVTSLTAGSLLVNGAASFVQSPTAPTPADNSNDTTVATTAFVKNAFTANDAMVFKGTIGSSGATVTSLPATHKQGWTYKVITAGTYAGQVCEIGDTIYCVTDGTSANNDHWTVVQTNIDGAVIGPASSTSGNLALFNGTTGKLIADSGKSVTTSTATSSSTDGTIPTSKAVWSTIASLDGNLNSTTPGAGKTLTAFSQTDGKVSATFGDISITTSQISDFPTTMTPAEHAHGNITNAGAISTTAAIASGDKLVIVDSSNSNKLTGSSISFGTSANYFLTNKGTWAAANNYSLSAATTAALGGVRIGYTENEQNYPVELNSNNQMYVSVPWTDTTYSFAAGTADLSWNTTVTLATVGGISIDAKLPANPNSDTKNTVGSTQDANKLFLVGAKTQSASAQSYSHTAVYATAGELAATKFKVAENAIIQYNTTSGCLEIVV